LRTGTSANVILGDESLTNSSTIPAVGDIIPSQTSFSKQISPESSFGYADDDELQEMLSSRRRHALKRRKITQPEDFVRKVQISPKADKINNPAVPGLVIDETNEFVRGIEMTQQSDDQLNNDRLEVSVPHTQPMEVDTPADVPAESIVADEMKTESELGYVLPSPELETEATEAVGIAATLAALKELLKQGWIDSEDRIVLFNTGSGLKYLDYATQ